MDTVSIINHLRKEESSDAKMSRELKFIMKHDLRSLLAYHKDSLIFEEDEVDSKEQEDIDQS